MANKIPWYISINREKIFGILVLIMAMVTVVAYLAFPEYKRSSQLRRFTGKTYGTVTNVKENNSISQTQEGTKIGIKSLTIYYTYKVNESLFQGTEELKATPVTIQKINEITEGEAELMIRYDPSNPNNSMIFFNSSLEKIEN